MGGDVVVSHIVGAMTRQAVAISRRASLRLLGGAAAGGALAAPAAARARKGAKQAKKRCEQQEAQCSAAVTAYCGKLIEPAACESVYLPCCPRFTECNVEAGIACILTAD
jgi:hypothetical protein